MQIRFGLVTAVLVIVTELLCLALTSQQHRLKMRLPETFRIGMIPSLTTSYPDTRREHRPAAPHACALPPRQRSRRPPRPSPRRPRTRFLPRATRPHSPNPHLGRWTTPASLLIARPTALPAPPVRMQPFPRFAFSPEPVP